MKPRWTSILPGAAAVLLTVLVLDGCGGGVTIRAVDTTTVVSDPDGLYTSILADHVVEGRVDYDSLCRNDSLGRYIAFLARARPDTMASPRDRLAFWINAYNAYTLKVICDNYPVESINDLHFGGLALGTVTRKTIWHRKFAVVGDVTYSLNQIEHDIIRPRFGDARVHFALVCAARSCPPLRAEAYVGSRLDEQLDDQSRLFFSQADKNHFDTGSHTAYLSSILDWYKGDFGSTDEDVLLFVARFLDDSTRAAIESDPGGWRIKHTRYDWSLNR